MKINNKVLKIVGLIASLLSLLSLAGCTNYQKQKALYEYSQSLQSDVFLWETAEMTSNQMQNARTLQEMASYANTISGYLDDIVISAEERNATITDPDIKDIDDSYVQYCKDLKNSFKMISEGINENDEKKIKSGEKLANSGIENVKLFSQKLTDYIDKYEIKTDEDALKELEGLMAGM